MSCASSAPHENASEEAVLNTKLESIELAEELNSNEDEFTRIVGLVEDIFVGEDFQARHTKYFKQHCPLFSEEEAEISDKISTAELEHLTKEKFNVFRTYSVEMAAFLEAELKKVLGEQFEIDGFIQEVEDRTKRAEAMAQEKAASEGDSPGGSPRGACASASSSSNPQGEMDDLELLGIDSEIFETLLILKDYGRFQELMVDFLKMKQGKMPDMNGLVSHRKISDEEADSL